MGFLERLFGLLEIKQETIKEAQISFLDKEESEIFVAVANFFFSPPLRSISAIPVPTEQPNKERYERFEKSNEYSFVVNFVNKFNDDYSAKDLIKLRQLLTKKGFNFSDDELKRIINSTKNDQEYLKFKKKILYSNPKLIKQYIEEFVNNFDNLIAQLNAKSFSSEEDILIQSKSMSVKLYFLKKLCKESNLEFKDEHGNEIGNEDLIRAIVETKEKTELERFEKTISSETKYSIEQVDVMIGYDFERFLKTLFEKMGYLVEHTKLSGDQGADLVVSKQGETITIQAKRSVSKITNNAIQEVVASINHYKAQKGMVVTNNYFTSSAVELAKSNKISLVDRDELAKLIKEYL